MLSPGHPTGSDATQACARAEPVDEADQTRNDDEGQQQVDHLHRSHLGVQRIAVAYTAVRFAVHLSRRAAAARAGCCFLAIAGAAVILHTILAHIDVSYTEGRRHISPLEQSVHGYLEVLPLVAFGLYTILLCDKRALTANAASAHGSLWLLASYLVLAGIPIAEELCRTVRGARGARF